MARDGSSERRRERAHRASQAQAAQLSRVRPLISSGFGVERRAEVLIAEDQDLRNHLQAPYDPLYGAQAARFFTRGTLQAATEEGFLRVGAIVVAVVAAVGCLVGTSLTIQAVVAREGNWGATALWTALFTFMQGASALEMMRRLRGNARRN